MESPYLEPTFRSRLVKLLKPKKDASLNNKLHLNEIHDNK
jgi:hypothetical protein